MASETDALTGYQVSNCGRNIRAGRASAARRAPIIVSGPGAGRFASRTAVYRLCVLPARAIAIQWIFIDCRVAGSMMPVGLKPWSRCHLRTARVVAGP